MRKLIVLILVASGLWGGYWFIGATAVENAMTNWLSGRQNAGWVVEYSDLKTRGFPNRFDTRITDLTLADTNSGIAWQTPSFEVLALSYKPNHIIAVWPPQQTVASPYEKIAVTNERMRASVVFEADTALALDRTDFELDDFTLQSDAGWSARIGKGQFSTRKIDADEEIHKIWFEASSVYPPAAVLAWLDPAGVLPQFFETLIIDTTLTFDAAWDRFAIEQARPQVININLNALRASWGKLDLRAAGELAVDGRGYPVGQITVKAKNWRDMLQIAVDAGIIPSNLIITVTRALEVMAEMTGDPKTLDLPLTFKKGRISVGLIPLGPAPRLVLR